MRRRDYTLARSVIHEGLAAQAFPAAVVDVGTATESRWQESFGRLTFNRSAAPCTTEIIFDVASLTKVLETAPLAMALVQADRLDLDAPVGALLKDWRGDDRARATARQLLDHSSGLPGKHDAWRTNDGRASVKRTLAELPLT
jgi:CubicO group peptidase (beta-lactamase class C family)